MNRRDADQRGPFAALCRSDQEGENSGGFIHGPAHRF